MIAPLRQQSEAEPVQYPGVIYQPFTRTIRSVLGKERVKVILAVVKR